MIDVVVADDDDLYRDTLIEVLEHDGYSVGVARTGLEAFELLRHHPVRLGVLDYRMPEMTGIEVLIALQELGIIRKTLMLTAEAPEVIERSRNRVTIAKLLHKPFEIEEFRSSVEYLTSCA